MRVMSGAAIICCALLLPGCGIRGPLYLPPVPSAPAAQQATEPEKADPETRPETPSASSHE